MKRTIRPAILYFGTPVVVLSTRNADDTFNLAPFSSVFWLGSQAILGLNTRSRTVENLRRTGETVINLPSDQEADAVDRLALTTGADPVPATKVARGYRSVGDKFGLAGVTPCLSVCVEVPSVAEFPIHLEATLTSEHPLTEGLSLFVLEVCWVAVEEELVASGSSHRIDPDRWRPLIMSFQQFYGLAQGRLRSSTLASIPEEAYRKESLR